MPPKNRLAKSFIGEYVGHFFRFLATFVFIIGIALFIFSFTSGS